MTDLKFRALSEDADEDLGYQWAYSNDMGICSFFDDVEYEVLQNKTLGQFTGLKDKNDKDIYEGDILEIAHPMGTHNITVVFKDGCFSTQYSVTIFDYIWHNYGDDSQENLATVIGNIHENPDLLA